MSGFVDAQTDDVGESLESVVCIIGAGAAGITLARELSKTVPDVLLIEAGGMKLDGQTQNLFAGRQLGLRYYNLTSCRLRYFGGTTNHWSGFCRTNDPIDYEGRPELGLPEWPVKADSLAPYVEAAGETLNIEAKHFDPRSAMDSRGLSSDGIAEDFSDVLMTKVFQLSDRRRLSPLYHDTLDQSPNLKTVLNLNLTHIQLTEDAASVSHLVCKTLTGKTVTIRARYFALCCHGIENARQLLIANDTMKSGIGNTYDHVGRYFMDHTHIFASKWIPSPSFPQIYNRAVAAHNQLNVNVSFTDEFTREKRLLQYYCRFNPVYIQERTEEALRRLRLDKFKPGDLNFLRDIARVARDVSGVQDFRNAKKGTSFAMPDYFEMEHRLEQAPNPDSRVVISDRRDALDSPIADLDWRINEHDVNSFRDGQDAAAREMSALGWGRLQKEEITRELIEERVAGHYHQIGTTRMSVNPRDGVVDPNCRVHGVSNLYIGGSSVFPTAGYSGPTMMLIAFAMRLSDHLKEKLA